MSSKRHDELVIVVGCSVSSISTSQAVKNGHRVIAYRRTFKGRHFHRKEVLWAKDPRELHYALMTMKEDPPLFVTVEGRCEEGITPEEVTAINEQAQRTIQTLHQGKVTIDHSAETWNVHQLLNLPEALKWPTIFDAPKCEGMPCVIVSPGPSLDKNIDQLFKIQQKVLVITYTQALASCKAHGIRPDFVLCADSHESYLDHVKGFDLDSTCFVPTLTVYPDLFKLGKRKYLIGFDPEIDSWVESILGQLVVRSAGSVSTMAFNLAVHWGCNPIIYIGQELSTNDKYAKDVDGRIWKGEKDQTRMVKSWDSKSEVEQSVSYMAPHRFLEDVAKVLGSQRPGLKLLNCTEGGAFIDGFEHTKFRDVFPLPLALPNKPPLEYAGVLSSMRINSRIMSASAILEAGYPSNAPEPIKEAWERTKLSVRCMNG